VNPSERPRCTPSWLYGQNIPAGRELTPATRDTIRPTSRTTVGAAGRRMMADTPVHIPGWQMKTQHAGSPDVPNRNKTTFTKLHSKSVSKHMHAHAHTHTHLTALSRTTRVRRYQKGNTNLDFTEARDSEWQWHQVTR